MEINNSFEMLIGDIKNPSIVAEDKSERKERREKRREGRREKRYMEEGKDFNLNSFISSLSSLKNSIIAQITDCDNRMDSKVLGGKAAAEKYKKIFMTHLDKVAVLLGEAQYRKSRGEGRKLEAGQDVGVIESFRENYNKVLNDFNKSAEDYNTEAGKEVGQVVSKIEFKSIQEPLDAANKAFLEAAMLASDLLIEIKNKVASEGGSQKPTDQKSGEGDNKTSSTSSVKIVNEIKAGTTPTGENAEIAKKVYALICEKWKESKTLTASSQWKASGFCNPNKLIIGPNRTACIKAIKAAYKMEDKSGNLTQAFVDKLSASEVIKESTDFRRMSESLNLLSFEDFISGKSKIGVHEQVDMDALKKSLSSGTSSGKSKSSSSGSTPESPFKSKEEGDAFRKWVNDKHSDWAKENKLDSSGSHTNSFIIKAWNKFKDEYKPGESKSGGESDKKSEKITKESAEEMMKKADEMLLDANNKIKDFYANSGNFEEYKSIMGDDEEDAVKYIFGSGRDDKSSWFYKNIRRKYTTPVYQTIQKLKESGDVYEEYFVHLNDELQKVINLYRILKKKTLGNTNDDSYTWSYTSFDGEKTTFKVDTDF